MSEERKKRSISARLLIQFAASFCFLAVVAIALGAQNKPRTTPSKSPPAPREEAKTVFEAACASCHGLDARGGERGPDIVSRSEVVRKTDAELLKILTDGKTAEGMPAFAPYGSEKLSALVVYLRTLQGRGKVTSLPGDPIRGKALFLGKAKCAECHMVRGQGGFFAQDLTAYATRMDSNEVRAAIINPNKDLDPRRGLVTVTLADSTTFSGIARNEDNFSLQLQTPDGLFHLLSKSDVRDLIYTGKSPMPSDYGYTLSSQELNDLVGYLLDTSQSVNVRNARNNREEPDEE
jgi:cytochrome c oxidase cbb3-type subunit III